MTKADPPGRGSYAAQEIIIANPNVKGIWK